MGKSLACGGAFRATSLDRGSKDNGIGSGTGRKRWPRQASHSPCKGLKRGRSAADSWWQGEQSHRPPREGWLHAPLRRGNKQHGRCGTPAFLWEWGFGTHQAGGQRDQPTVQILGAECVTSFPGRRHPPRTPRCHMQRWRDQVHPVGLHRGGSGKPGALCPRPTVLCHRPSCKILAVNMTTYAESWWIPKSGSGPGEPQQDTNQNRGPQKGLQQEHSIASGDPRPAT